MLLNKGALMNEFNKKTNPITPRHLYCSMALFKPFVSSCPGGGVFNRIVVFKK